MLLRIIGRVFIAAGVVILLFLAYELFGTNFVTGRNQKALAADFDRAVAAQPQEPPEVPAKPDLGEGIARIIISKLELNWVVVEGVGPQDLKKGPGHMSETPMPGEKGNSVVSGHRTTYGAPFFRLDELGPGDEIKTVTLAGEFVYRVTETKIVQPTDRQVTAPVLEEFRLTLTTCHPRFSAGKRLIVVAHMEIPAEEVAA